MRMFRPSRNWLFLSALLALSACQGAPVRPIPGAGDIGVVLMHGKSGTPDSHIAGLAGALRSAGVRVETPEMAWSRSRRYDRTYEDALKEIDAAAGRLRAAGAKRIVVAGHSLGANAALGYAARREGLAGAILLAPGHFPSGTRFQEVLGESVQKAERALRAGRGDQSDGFRDLNVGRTDFVTTTARIYASWMRPDGPASFRENAPNVKPGTPVLWVAGDRERSPLVKNRALIFDNIPAHPKSRFVLISSDHFATPDDAVPAVLDWLASL